MSTTPLTPAEIAQLPTTRNDFNALIHVPTWCAALMREAEQAGVYTTGIESVRRSRGPRGTSVNVDLYGYESVQGLCVIQVRECQFRAGRYSRVRKDYYLLGRTEDGAVFAHPVDSPARSKRAMASPEACVQFVLAQIWDCRIEDLDEIRRQGDVAFVPASLPASAKPLVVQTVTIHDTHVITAERIWQHGSTYYVSRRARAVHTKGEHAPVQVRHGYYRVQPGIRAKIWGFTAPTID